MKVLMVSTDRKVFEAGSAVRMRFSEYGGLVDSLHVIVFAKKDLRFSDETIAPNIFLYPTNTRTRLGYLCGALKCARALKKAGVRIDVVTTQDPFEAGLIGFFTARIFGAKLHLQVHTDFMSPYFARESFINRLRVHIAKFLLPRANAIRVVSERIRNSLVASGYGLKPIAVLPIFVETKLSGASQRVDLKKKYPQFSKVLLIASRLSPEKNIDMAIEAMREIVKKYPTTGLLIAGSGPEDNALLLKAKNYNLTPNIVFEGWQSDLDPYYRSADLFLLPSNYEGYGMTVVEALQTECPVVMTDVGCAGEVVRNGENGLVVPVGDQGAFTQAVLSVLSGERKLVAVSPRLPTKEEYLARYKESWETTINS